jgi:hypothetical protein
MLSNVVALVLYLYGEISPNLAGVVQRWVDVGIWSAAEDTYQAFIGL